ncbi:hypothetical protein KBX50_27385 [Micromonospora sp. C51]|uniref:hypothetical protein n=1 Tax=Micromonospora sp. C51 TaxID=2824879 RepID=UPI001B36F65C|nr:hypothetical protein [Micromonospora sp. C51]MBQ1052165.1 hypothetical protein [Micromonospora sp. C51]
MTPSNDTPPTEAAGQNLLQSRLRELFQNAPPGRGPYTEAEVARALTAAGDRITAEGIRSLLRSPNPNPKARTLQALARFFGVPAGYLLGDQETLEGQSRDVRVMARSITKLSPASQAGLAEIIDNLLRVEEAARTGESQHRPPASDQP